MEDEFKKYFVTIENPGNKSNHVELTAAQIRKRYQIDPPAPGQISTHRLSTSVIVRIFPGVGR